MSGAGDASCSTDGAAEAVDPIDLEERILSLCMKNPKGIRDDIIVKDQPFITTEQRMKALQRLMSRVWYKNDVNE